VFAELIPNKGADMLRFGAVLALFGFGSALLHFTDIQFRLLSWAEKWQPWLGLVMGGVGALFLLIATLRDNGEPAGQQPPQQGFGPPPAGYGPPPGGFAQPPASPPGGFAQPQPGPGYGTPPSGFGQPYPPPIPQQGPQYGPRPPQGPPQPRGPVQDFGPQGGPPFGPQGR
jgi:hypothetical protein